MPIKDMPAYVLSHRNILNAVLCSVAACFFLTLQLVFMERTVIAVMFDIIIPFSAAVTFGCYAITMAADRPIILICPPMAYFLSLLINQLFSVEWHTGETYPIFTLIEIVPVIFYCGSVATGKLKKPTNKVLKAGCILILLTVAVLLVLALFFKIALYSKPTKTFAMTLGMVSVFWLYIGMLEQLKIAGTEKKEPRYIRFFGSNSKNSSVNALRGE